MIGYTLNRTGGLSIARPLDQEDQPRQHAPLETSFYSPILLAMYQQREQRRLLFERHVITRTVPDAVHDLPRISFLERQQGE